MQPHSAMILAAGLGTRMRPLTLDRPKPLVEVAGRTLLDRALDAARAAGVGRAVVNVHYLADQIENHLETCDMETFVSDERDVLMDSGGGVVRAMPHLGDDPFFILNSDTFWRESHPPAALRAMSDLLDDAADMVLLLARREDAVGFDGRGDFHLDEGRPRRRGDDPTAPFVYAGAILARPAVFADAPSGPFSLNLTFDEAIGTGRMRAHVLDGLWLHVGTPQAIPLAEEALALWEERAA